MSKPTDTIDDPEYKQLTLGRILLELALASIGMLAILWGAAYLVGGW